MIQAEPVLNTPFFGQNVEVVGLRWDFDELTIEVFCPKKDDTVTVRFNNEFGPSSLRLLDESDLSENWSKYNMSQGWIYRVTSGGWFEQESQRDGFLLKHSAHIYKEYLVVGLDACVSVFTKEDVSLLNRENEVVFKIAT